MDRNPYIAISATGRYVTWCARIASLVPGDTNNRQDVFVRDRLLQTTTLESLTDTGTLGNDDAFMPSISSDGRYLAFESMAYNIVSGDTNQWADVFLRDRQTGHVVRLSPGFGTLSPNSVSYSPAVSSDGKFVAFGSSASNFGFIDTNSTSDVFIYDVAQGTVELASRTPDGSTGNGTSIFPSISDDGRFVSFTTWATNLVPGDTNGYTDAVVFDQSIGVVKRASLNSAGEQLNYHVGDSSGEGHTYISGNGVFLAFESPATNIFPNDYSWTRDAFVRQMLAQHGEPINITLTEGELYSGDLSSILENDDVCWSCFNDSGTLMASVEMSGYSAVLSPPSILVTFEAAVARGGLAQVLSLWNYDLGSFVTLDGRNATTSDQTVSVSINENTASYIDPLGVMRLRVIWGPINDEAPTQDGWLHSIDLVRWF